MKRTMALLLALMALCLAFPAQAEEGFRFRNGVGWEADPSQVALAEGGISAYLYEEDDVLAFGYEGVEVSKYSAYLAYAFLGNELKVAGYHMPGDGEDIAYLVTALSTVYGQEQPQADLHYLADTLSNAIHQIIGADNFSDAHLWQAADGTPIYLVREDGGVSIYYLNPSQPLRYVTVGL